MRDDDDFLATFKSMGEAVAGAQGANLAQNYILHEILCDLARRSPDPEKYLSSMFERVSARADQGDVENEGHPVTVEFRWTVENLFKHAGNAVRRS
ncbi:MAG: hypothetical protein ACT6QU_15485 [Aliihoeflea sp.]|uniref:hypothetical protein n=1 Tax=Aliihoeflea sp. TaxID=2608088 RepID=UPI0040343927